LEHQSKKLIIYYFSGTGNARNVANWSCTYALKRGWEAEIRDIAKTDRHNIPAVEPGTMVGLASPTHGFNLPPIVLKFLSHFPRGKANPVWIVNTRAGLKAGKVFLPGLTGIGQLWAALVLRMKNYRVLGMRPIDLPSNWISIHPGLRAKVSESITARCYRKSVAFSEKMLNGKRDYRALFDLIQDLLVAPVALGYYFIGRFFLAKGYIATSSCTACDLCIRECPVQAIRKVRGRPYWTLKCESCMRCMNHCPERAIETPHGFLTAILYLVFTAGMEGLYFLTVDKIASPVLSRIMEHGSVRLLVGSALTIPFLLLSYHIVHLLIPNPVFNRLIAFTSLTHFRFWRRYRAPRYKPE